MSSPVLTAAPPDAVAPQGLAAPVEAQAAARPDAPAVVFGERTWTYAELNAAANRLARRLIERGVGPDVCVGVSVGRSFDMMVAVLAVLKAGGAYVPLDPGYPRERLALMLEDCAAPVVLTAEEIAAGGFAPASRQAASGVGSDPATAEHLGYVIFTSGSTGRPKGVAMRRGALANLIAWQQRNSIAGTGDATLQFASLSFDVSFQEIFSTWATGGALVLLTEEERRDPAALWRLIVEHHVARVFVPFVMLQQLAEAAANVEPLPDSLREVITAGEQLQITPAVRRLFERLPDCTLHNHYGPSETHVATAYTLTGPPAEWPTLPPIGRPIDGAEVVVVGPDLRPVPDGETGELLIGGDCLARGYLNRPELTAERFIDRPDQGTRNGQLQNGSALHAPRPSTWYRTGDLARVRPNGELEFLGRADQQVKVRGFRVEPGEVETALCGHDNVKEAAVVARDVAPGDRQLIGYVVARTGTAPAVDELRQFLSERLPDYMVPAAFVILPALPLTPSGKVDRKALPAPSRARPALAVPFVAPRNPAEEAIAAVWRDVLRLDAVGVHDPFFDLGGHSLALARVHAKLRTALAVELPITVLFQHPTIAALAVHVEGLAQGEDAPVPPAPTTATAADGIAVIGFAGRFPGAADVDAFWRNLCAGVESISFFSDEELLAAGTNPALLANPDFVKARGVLADADRFDAAFFGYAPREAELTDPQQRLFLESAWAALEHAGYVPEAVRGRVGVYAGSSLPTYLLHNVLADRAAADELTGQFQSAGYPVLIGNDKDYLATRVAYKLNLRGPALTVQTACSTSLVAVCQAAESLLAGQCDVALAGGVSVTFPQQRGSVYQEGAITSPDGHCRAFDADARGTVFGEGVGVVVLKRLADARADGDTIHAVLKGLAVNNDGADKVSYVAPSVDGQADAVAAALTRAGWPADAVGYVEAHGTGTPLGDPIEVAGLTQAFRRTTDKTGFCALGSVKPNIGHLEAAAGVTGFIKAVLAVRDGVIPPTLHYRRPNPAIDFAHSPFVVAGELTAWRGAGPRRAGVSSMGVGGTNAHVVLEQPPTPTPTGPSWPDHLLVLSARTPAALDRAAANLADFLRQHPNADLADITYTLQAGRRAMEHRRAVVARDADDAVAALTANDSRRVLNAGPATAAPPVAFLFPGQGAQHVQMAAGLYLDEPTFRAPLDLCAEVLKAHLGLDPRDLLYPDPAKDGAVEAARRQLAETRITQPVLFAVEYALAQMWLGWGVRPKALLGHSIGEYVAACLAGVFALEDALTLVAKRGALVQALPGGAMLAVRADEAAVRPLVPAELSLAAVNGPGQCVVSGAVEAIEAFSALLAERKVGAKRLATSHAFHSAMLDPVLAEFAEAVQRVERRPPTVPFVSCVTGTWITAEQATSPDYWASQLRQTVRFADGLRTVAEAGAPVLLEVGPGRTLTNLAQQSDRDAIATLPAEGKGDDLAAVLEAVGRLWLRGAAVDWRRFHALAPRRRVPLPTYPFERQRYWIEPPKRASSPLSRLCGRGDGGEGLPPPSPGFAGEGPGVRVDWNSPLTPIPSPAKPGEGGQEEPPRADRLLAELRGLLAELSGLAADAIDPQASFFELGFDSLFLTQAVQAVQAKFGVRVSFRQLLEDLATPAALARHLDATLPAEPMVDEAAPKADAAPESTDTLRQLLAQQQQILDRLTRLEGGSVRSPAAPRVAEPAPTSGFGSLAPVDRSTDSPWPPRQQQFLDALIRRYTTRTAKSKAHIQEHRRHHADPRTVSGFVRRWKEIVYPIVVERSAGSRLWDLDGNEYIDLLNGFGPDLLGHSPPFVVQAVAEQLHKGYEVGPTPPLAGELARLVCELTGLERASFVCTGSEAVQAALRCARTVTGRDKVVTFSRDYHGNFDEVLLRGVAGADGSRATLPSAPGVPRSAVGNMVVLDYGAPESLEVIRRLGPELAAVLVEPVQSRRPELQPREFLHEVRRITEQSGTCLIFDEVITGFRLHPRGAQAFYGVRADLATYGKIIGGGMPIGLVAGSAAYMDAFDGGWWNYGDDSFPPAGRTFFAGTFIRHPLGLAAGLAALRHLKDHGPALQEQLGAAADRLVAELNAIAQDNGVPMQVVNCGSLMFFRVLDGQETGLLFYLLRERGVYILEGFPSYLSTAHTDADLAAVVEAFRSSVAEMRAAGFFGGRAAVPPPAAAEDLVPLTPAQTELWLAAETNADASCSFNESCSLDLRGPFDPDAFRAAVARLIERHEALRTTFDPAGTGQTVHGTMPVAVPLTDLSGRPEADLAVLLDAADREPFDLAAGPLLRVALVRLAAEHHVAILTAHHIACDGWAYDIVLHELAELYSAAKEGRPAVLPAPDRFTDYARRQAGRGETAELAYWREQFRTLPPPLDLPADRARPARRTFRGDRLTVPLGAELAGQVKRLAARLGCTPYAALFAGFHSLVYRLTGQTDLVVGIPTAGQARVGGKALVGHCVNFLPVRVGVDPARPFADFARGVSHTLLDALDYGDFTVVRLMRELNVPRDAGRAPLVAASFNLDPDLGELHFAGLRCRVDKNPRHFVNFELTWNLVEEGDDYLLECEYNTDMFDRASAERWAGHYRALLGAAAADPSAPVGTLPLLSTPERHRVLEEWNDTAADYPRDRTAAELIAEQARRTPQRLAVRGDDAELTYADLEARAERVARRLRALGVGPDVLVAVYLERSAALVAAVLGVWKAGGAYLPLDPAYPPERLALYVRDGEPAAVLTQRSLLAELPPTDAPQVLLDDLGDGPAGAEDAGPRATADHLAYVIYTSGSTGMPNGVEVPHRGLVNCLWSMRERPGLTADDVTLAHTTLSFDPHTVELWLPLMVGGRVEMVPRAAAADGLALRDRLERSGATVLQATPASWRLLLAAGWEGDQRLKALCGGEAMTAELAGELLPRVGQLWNIYGPTEATVWNTVHHVTAAETPIPVGRPIANTRVYILDARLEPVPVGAAGDLWIGGDGITRGYRGRPGLTAERFRDDPFVPGARMYRTGDLGRFRPDGTIECLGRTDHQVKVRGFRIELGEVEAALAKHPAVAHAAAAAPADAGGERRLAAYVVPKPGLKPEPAELGAFLRERLPAYMVPTHYVELAALPLTPNGKVDRKALPAPGPRAAAADRPRIAPRSDAERDLLPLWAEVLREPDAGIADDFFDLGGHSLAAAELVAAIRTRLGHTVPLGVLYEASTVEKLAAVLKNRLEAGSEKSVVALQETGTRPPLFLFAGVGGHVFAYHKFARLLGPAQPTYGVKAIGVDGTRPPPERVEEIAAEYVREITAVRPRGPYLLGGYSVGAVLALEVALQLQRLGHDVPLLAAFDASAPGYLEFSLPQRLVLHARNLFRKGGGVGYVKQRFRNLGNRVLWAAGLAKWNAPAVVGHGLDALPQDALKEVWVALHRAERRYRPAGKFVGRLVMFRAEKLQDWDAMVGGRDPLLGWSRWHSGAAESHSVPVSHLELFQEPTIFTLARTLGQAIEKVNS